MDSRPGPGDDRPDDSDDVDARWAEIVADLSDLADAGRKPGGDDEPTALGRPARRDAEGDEDIILPPRRRRDDLPPRDVGRGARVIRPAAPEPSEDPSDEAFGPRSWAPDPAVEEAEDHFVPPDPGPVLGGNPLLTLAWSAVVGVPTLIVIATIFWRDIPSWLLQVAGAAFLAGVGLLVWRMPHRKDPDDDDSGAVV